MSKWLKVGGALLVAVLLVTALGGIAMAQTPSEDSDGVRDLVGAGAGPAWGFVDENGDGINDNFVDEDGDGICDLCGTGGAYGPRGQGARFSDGTTTPGGYGRNMANPAFVDADGDGVCDNYAQTGAQRMGRGRWAAGQ